MDLVSRWYIHNLHSDDGALYMPKAVGKHAQFIPILHTKMAQLHESFFVEFEGSFIFDGWVRSGSVLALPGERPGFASRTRFGR